MALRLRCKLHRFLRTYAAPYLSRWAAYASLEASSEDEVGVDDDDDSTGAPTSWRPKHLAYGVSARSHPRTYWPRV